MSTFNICHQFFILAIGVLVSLLFANSSVGQEIKDQTQRTWTSATGTFNVEATLREIKDDSVVLEKENGSSITVLLEKLGESDRKHVSDLKKAVSKAVADQMKEVSKAVAAQMKEVVAIAASGELNELTEIPFRPSMPFVAVRVKGEELNELHSALIYDLDQTHTMIVVPRLLKVNPNALPDDEDGMRVKKATADGTLNQLTYVRRSNLFVQLDLEKNELGVPAEFTVANLDLDKQIMFLTMPMQYRKACQPAEDSELAIGQDVTVLMAVPRQGKDAHIQILSGRSRISEVKDDKFTVSVKAPTPHAIGIVLDANGKGLGIVPPADSRGRGADILATRYRSFYDPMMPAVNQLFGYWYTNDKNVKTLRVIAATDTPAGPGTRLIIDEQSKELHAYGFWTREQESQHSGTPRQNSSPIKMLQSSQELVRADRTALEKQFGQALMPNSFYYTCDFPVEFDDHRASQVSIAANLTVKSRDESGDEIKSNPMTARLPHLNQRQRSLFAWSDFWSDPYKPWSEKIKITSAETAYPHNDSFEGPAPPAAFEVANNPGVTENPDGYKQLILPAANEFKARDAISQELSFGTPTHLEISADEKVAWIENQAGHIMRIELPSLTATHQVRMPYEETGSRPPASDHAYVYPSRFLANSSEGLLSGDHRGFFVLDRDTLKIKKWISIPTLHCLTSSHKLPFAYVLSSTNAPTMASFRGETYLSVVDLRTGKIVHRILNQFNLPDLGSPQAGFAVNINAGKRPTYDSLPMSCIKVTRDGKRMIGVSDCLLRFTLEDDGGINFEQRSPVYLFSNYETSIWISGDDQYVSALGTKAHEKEFMPQYFGPGKLDFITGSIHRRGTVEIYKIDDLSRPVKNRQPGKQSEILTYVSPLSKFVFDGEKTVFGKDLQLKISTYLPKTKRWIASAWTDTSTANGNMISAIVLKDLEDVAGEAMAESPTVAAAPDLNRKSLVLEKWNEGVFEFTEINLANVPPFDSVNRHPPEMEPDQDGSFGRMIRPVWSQNGNYFYLLSPQGTLRKIEVETADCVGQVELGSPDAPTTDMTLTRVGLVVACMEEQQVTVINPDTLAVEKTVSLPLVKHILGSPAHAKLVSQNSNGSISLFDLEKEKLLDSGDVNVAFNNRFSIFETQLTHDGKVFFTSEYRFEIQGDSLVRDETQYRQENDRFSEWRIASDNFLAHVPPGGKTMTLHRIDDLENPVAVFEQHDGPRGSSDAIDLRGFDAASNLAFSSTFRKPINAHNVKGDIKYEFIPAKDRGRTPRFSFPAKNGKAFLWIDDCNSTSWNSRDRIFIIRHVPRS